MLNMTVELTLYMLTNDIDHMVWQLLTGDKIFGIR